MTSLSFFLSCSFPFSFSFSPHNLNNWISLVTLLLKLHPARSLFFLIPLPLSLLHLLRLLNSQALFPLHLPRPFLLLPCHQLLCLPHRFFFNTFPSSIHFFLSLSLLFPKDPIEVGELHEFVGIGRFPLGDLIPETQG